MSKFWKKMKILSKDGIHKSIGNSLFLSQENPSFSFNEDYQLDLISENNSSDEILTEISNLYSKHYKININNNVTLMSNNELTNYLNVNGRITRIYEESLLGCGISLYIPVKIDTKLDKTTLITLSEELNSIGSEGSIILGYYSFLVLDIKYRRKGLGMAIIQKSLQELYNLGGLIAFFVNRNPRCINSIPLEYWYFPINLSKLDSINFEYPKNYKSLFNIAKTNLEIIKINEFNLETSWNLYTNLVSNKKIAFSPSLNYWSKWIKSFPTYMIKNGSELIGIFSFNSTYNHDPLLGATLSYGHVIICIGKQPDTIKCALYQSKEFYDILNIFQTGDLTKTLLKNVNAQKMPLCNYINFYNTGIVLSSNDFYVPIF